MRARTHRRNGTKTRGTARTATARRERPQAKTSDGTGALSTNVPVATLMTRPAQTIGADRSVEHLASRMLDGDLRRIPVVDLEGHLVGIVSRSDLAEHLVIEGGDSEEVEMARLPVGSNVSYAEAGYQVMAIPGATVADLMSRKVLCFRETDTVAQAARAMSVQRVHGAPVVDGSGVVVGMLSALDIMGWLAGLAPKTASEPVDDPQRRARRLLLSRRNELLGRYQREVRARSETEPDWVDQSVDEQSVTRADGIAGAERAQIIAIDAALKRLAEGEWGICTSCAQLIEPARLAAFPEAALCRACADLQ